LDFRVLGAVEARLDGRLLDLGPAKQRLVLTILLTAEGRQLATDVLVDRIWSDRPPRTSRDLLYGYVSNLRTTLNRSAPGVGDSLLPKGAYRALVGPEHVDLHRFHRRRRAGQGVRRDDPAKAASLFREALREWGPGAGLRGGEPLTGLPGQWASDCRETLRNERRETLLACLDAELRVGHHSRLVAELDELARAEPLDQEVTRMLMLALYRTGRLDEALAAYTAVRKRLDEELGADPGVKLRNLHQRILEQDPSLMLPDPADEVPIGMDDRTTMGETTTARAASDRTGPQEAGAHGRRDTDRTATLAGKAARLVAEGSNAEGGQRLNSWFDLSSADEATGALVALVRTRLHGDPVAERALVTVGRRPDDIDAVRILQDVLVRQMTADRSFAAEVERMVERAGSGRRRGHVVTVNADHIKNAQIFNAPVKVDRDFKIS
jgi:DNA-binding SARP family transcriptional activator